MSGAFFFALGLVIGLVRSPTPDNELPPVPTKWGYSQGALC
jgi:hypothetical protein